MKLSTIVALAATALVQGGVGLAKPVRGRTAPSEKVADVAPRGLLDPLFEISVLGGNTMRIKQVPNGRFFSGRRGPMALAKAYRKFGIPIPQDLLLIIEALIQEILAGLRPPAGGAAPMGPMGGQAPNMFNMSAAPAPAPAAGAAQGDVAAVPAMFDSEYLCPVQIGTPPQTLNLDFDTGSSDLWVFSSETPKTQIMGQTAFNIQQSSTAKLLQGATWKISYGDGSGASGAVYMDTVTVGGVTVENQAVESARQVSQSFSQDGVSDGLLGLAFSNINTVTPTKQKTFFDNALENLASPLFTANLKKTEAGNYNFGFIDSTEFTGQVTFVDSNTTRGFWEFQASGFSVGELPANTLEHVAIADTGTTLMLLPEEIVKAYYAEVPTSQNNTEIGGFVFSCNQQLPDFTALIGDYAAKIPGDFINFAPADSDDPSTATLCFGGIQAAPAGFPFAIYGDVFLKAQFVVFHGGNKQLGFAPKDI